MRVPRACFPVRTVPSGACPWVAPLRLFHHPPRLIGLGNYSQLRRLAAFGTGAGIQIAGPDLEVAVARVRPTGVEVLARITIARFRERPAAEWGAEYAALLGKLADVTSIYFVYTLCSYLPAIGLLTAFLPNLHQSKVSR